LYSVCPYNDYGDIYTGTTSGTTSGTAVIVVMVVVAAAVVSLWRCRLTSVDSKSSLQIMKYIVNGYFRTVLAKKGGS
jgi:hypothetical protein